MIRRNIRLRKEYMYRKAEEQKERAVVEKKRKIREYMEAGKALPTELRRDELELREQLRFEDNKSINRQPGNSVDDEYANAGIHDPKVLITTSRQPSSRLGQFAKEMRLIFPNAERLNRGGYDIKELLDFARSHDVTDFVLFTEHRGEPDGMIVSHLPYGPTAYFTLSKVVLRHDLDKETRGTVSEAYPHLIFHHFTSHLGERVKVILKHLFPVPRPESRRIMTFANENDFIAFRHHTYDYEDAASGKKNKKDIALREIGPRFDMKLYQIKLGTADMREAEDEWVLRPYMNSKKSRLHDESIANEDEEK